MGAVCRLQQQQAQLEDRLWVLEAEKSVDVNGASSQNHCTFTNKQQHAKVMQAWDFEPVKEALREQDDPDWIDRKIADLEVALQKVSVTISDNHQELPDQHTSFDAVENVHGRIERKVADLEIAMRELSATFSDSHQNYQSLKKELQDQCRWLEQKLTDLSHALFKQTVSFENTLQNQLSRNPSDVPTHELWGIHHSPD